MDQWEQFAAKLLALMGWGDYRTEVDGEKRRAAVFIYDHPALVKENLPVLVESLNHIAQLFAKKNNTQAIFFDVNNYRQERETLITELARAAAKKALATKSSISLPAMNSYERRLVHLALAVHPDVATESFGNGKERFVIIKPIEEVSPGTTTNVKSETAP
jgi:predicted RNA-binding protein Jag